MSFFFHWKWKWHEKGKNCFKGNMVKSELCWILFDKMKLRRNRNYVENEFSCGVCWNSVVYFFLYKCKIKAFREYDISFIRKNAKSRDFSHHELSVNELKSLEYRDCDILSFFPCYSNVAWEKINGREWITILWSIRVRNEESVYVRSCK